MKNTKTDKNRDKVRSIINKNKPKLKTLPNKPVPLGGGPFVGRHTTG